MKKILLTALLVSLTAGVFAQGTVQFRNYWTSTSPVVDARVTDSTTGLFLDNNFRAALIGGPTTATAASLTGTPTAGTLSLMFYPTTAATSTTSWVPFRAAPGTTAPNLPGYVNPGSTIARAVPGVDYGGTALVQMVAWSGPYTTWADAYTAWLAGNASIGVSNPLTLKLPTSATDPNATYLWGLNSFAIAPIPEPTTFALAGLGAAALLIFRRRS